MRLDLREPARPGSARIEDELERAGPSAAPRRLVDREVAPQQERPALGHRDRDELPGRTRSATSGATIVIEWYAPMRLAFRTSARTRLMLGPRHRDASRRDLGGSCPNTSRSWTATAASAASWYSCSERGSPPSPRTDSIPRSAARTAGSVVMHGMPACAAAARISEPSVRGPRPNGVFTTRSTSASRIRSTTERPPSETFATLETAIPARSSTAAVPRVASRRNPRSARRLAGYRIDRLSRFATDRKIVPSRRQRGAARDQGLGERAARVGVDPHHLARRAHLGPEQRVDPREAPERQHGRLHRRVGQPQVVPGLGRHGPLRRGARRASDPAGRTSRPSRAAPR